MHLAEDIAIIEPMDEDGCPVGAGQTAQKVYLTSLINTTLPVIRYEMSDRIQLIDEPCPCGSTLPKIADLQERIDELFHYRGDTHVHMHLMRSALSHEPNMIDYQILQTEDGVRVLLKAKGPIDCRAVRRRITAALADAGVARPRVEVEVGARLWRLATGKLKRYVPLGFDGLTQEARA
jgi:phenylacetate-coenzyme A ligase PaaK-like adenylate-forming protein